MAGYVQADRHLSVETPLGVDVLLLRGLEGAEGLSRLFRFDLDVVAVNGAPVPFDALLGRKVTARLALAGGEARHFSGICSRVGEGVPDATFTPYRLEVVPQLWFLTRVAQSRIFQQVGVPDILKQVLDGLRRRLSAPGRPTSLATTACSIARPTSTSPAASWKRRGSSTSSRHEADGHTMVVADTPQGHPDLPVQSRIEFDEFGRRRAAMPTASSPGRRARSCARARSRSGTTRFELPHKHLEADRADRRNGPGRRRDAQAEARPERQARALRLPRRLRPAVRRRRPRRRRPPGRPRRRSSRTTSGPSDSACRRRRPGGLVDPGRRATADTSPPATSSRSSDHCNADGPYVLVGVEHDGEPRGRLPLGHRERACRTPTAFTCIPAALPFRPSRDTPQPGRPRDADGRGRRARGRGDLHRQVRPREGAVPLGPPGQERRQQLVLGPRRHPLGRQAVGRDPHPPRRPGGRRRLRGGRPRPADHRRQRLQRRPDAPLHPPRQQDPERPQEPQHPRRARPRTSTSCASRTRRAPRRSTSTPRRTSTASSRTTTP